MALWGKKEGEDEAPEPTRDGGGSGDELARLSETLEQFGEMLQVANRQVTDYLLRRESQAGGSSDTDLLRPISEKLDQLAEKLQAAAESGPSPGEDAPAPAASAPAVDHTEVFEAVGRLAEQLCQHGETVDGALGHVWQRLDEGLREVAAKLEPEPEPEQPPQEPAADDVWQQALLGVELAGQDALAEQRERLLADLHRGDEGARGLVGQLLVFQATPAERMAQVLRDIGEAYYRWQPKTTPGVRPLEEALAQWVTARCDQAGIGNRIELVDPGERFDSARHSAVGRGVEITEVSGWIVLRDNGRVYTKANVVVH